MVPRMYCTGSFQNLTLTSYRSWTTQPEDSPVCLFMEVVSSLLSVAHKDSEYIT